MLVHAPYAYTHIDPLDPLTRRSGILRPLVGQSLGTISDWPTPSTLPGRSFI